MTRRLIVAIVRFALRIYFRQIEVVGLEHIPQKSPVIFVLNHPNALVDPVFLLCLAPRRVSFLAKAPLFRMPVLGSIIRAMDSLPVYRRQDEGEDVSRNNQTFAAARALLAAGGTIGICPEGVSHNEPGLQPIKTGAARIALGAISTGEVHDLKIVPAGLYYTAKTMFRSAALLYFGAPIDVSPVEIDTDGNPPRVAVRELSERIETALRAVILDAEHEEALHTINRAERIFSSEREGEGDDSLAAELQLLQRFVKAYAVLRETAPERLRKLELRMVRFEEQLRQAGLAPEEFLTPGSTAEVFLNLLTRSLVFALLALPAVGGALIHYPAYRLGGFLATRLSQASDDVISTIKIISAMLLFPLTWLVAALVAYELGGRIAALITLLLTPALGYLAIFFFEETDKFLGGLRALGFFLMKRRFYVRLLAERKAIRNEILALGDQIAIATR
ncbi:MAG TPA: lysophospholipid acyltransferase family protein [Pyrinomonadaceae bacterium]|nr:lysophospholipid acyltransferase family protein [Pyrinomonadaceae bacterium]